MKPETIEGKFIKLRKMTTSDVEFLHKWLNDSKVTQFLELKECSLPIEELHTNFFRELESENDVVFTITTQDDTPIGRCGLYHIDWTRKDAYMRILIGDKKFWNGRTALEAESLLIKFGFTKLQINKIYGYVHVENKGQQRLVEAVGLKNDGIMRDYYVRNQTYSDAIIYSILKKEYDKN